MRKADLKLDVIYAFGGKYGTPEPIRILATGDGWIEVEVLKEARPDAKVIRVRRLLSAQKIKARWEDYQVLHAAKQQAAFETAQRVDAEIEQAEKARRELLTLIPASVETPVDILRPHVFTWKDSGKMSITLDVEFVLALVKAARVEAIAEVSGTGGRFSRGVDHS